MLLAKIRIRYVIGGVLCVASIVYTIVQSHMSIIILAMTQPLYNTTTEPPDVRKATINVSVLIINRRFDFMYSMGLDTIGQLMTRV